MLDAVMPRKLTNFHIDVDQAEGLQLVKDREGVPIAEQIRRGIRMWLESKGIKAERKQAATRKRS